MAITAYDLKQETLEDISNSQSLHYNFKVRLFFAVL